MHATAVGPLGAAAISPGTGIAVTLIALALFAWAGVTGARRLGAQTRDGYLSARGTQGALSLALSFTASVLGAWILFSPPEVGTFAGMLGVGGYAAGQALAVAIFAVLGPAVMRTLPAGTTILEWVRRRYGRVMQAYTGAVSVLYMFVFLAAELTAIGGVLSMLAGTARWVPVVAVAVVTVAYTAYGGLPASIATDRWQAWLVMALVVVVAVAVGVGSGDPLRSAADGGLWTASRTGAEVGVVLVIAIVAANLFHQGFWQRVWAARDPGSLVRGTLGAGALVVPLLVLAGAGGAIAAGRGVVDDPSLALFTLVDGLPGPVVAGVVLLAVALVSSTADTLENALASLVAVHVAPSRMTLDASRWVTVLLTIPAAAIALQGVSVLRLFLVADLLAATIAVPVFAGLWRRATPAAAMTGAVAGLVAVIGVGWMSGEGLADGLRALTLPDGPALGPFVAAPVASAVATVVASLASPRAPDRRRAAGHDRARTG